ncbi:MAG: hypothetical protein ACRDOE_00590 [Streptosporangiaceae bacterium]
MVATQTDAVVKADLTAAILWPVATPFTVPVTAAAGGVQVTTFGGALLGWAVYETTGAAAAAFEIWDGTDTTGQRIAHITLAAGESTRDYVPPQGIAVERGLRVVVTAGSVAGELWASRRR